MLRITFPASISSIFFGLFGMSWDKIDQKIEEDFPGVAVISTGVLNSRLRDGTNIPVIIDVRETDEFEVSHLPGAINLQSATDTSDQIPGKATEIVVYCSVGYRSAAVVSRLNSMGYSNVRNLRHSIFEWANRGYPMHNLRHSTVRAHPYNRAWGQLLNQDLHQYDLEP